MLENPNNQTKQKTPNKYPPKFKKKPPQLSEPLSVCFGFFWSTLKLTFLGFLFETVSLCIQKAALTIATRFSVNSTPQQLRISI